MRKLPSQSPAGKTFRRFDGDEWITVTNRTTNNVTTRPAFRGEAKCVACGGGGAKFLDLQRGGLVCAGCHRTEVL